MEQQRQSMLQDIRYEAELTAGYTGRPAFSAAVMQAMAEVPRERFVPAEYLAGAFDNGPLPIGHGQTISQPYIVALMTDLLDLHDDERVLEIGTGCGYQTAILARLCQQVYSVERIPALAAEARQRLTELGYDNIETRCADGYQGWPEAAPFDAIIVTASATYIPPRLQEQLRPGGRMVIPVGPPHGEQTLLLLQKSMDGLIHSETILAVAFVPLVEELDEPK